MLRILLATAALAAVVALAPRPASAYGHAPWCAVMDIGWEDVVSDCSFWSFKACVPHVLGGNRGFCEPNPDWKGPIKGRHRRYPRHRAGR